MHAGVDHGVRGGAGRDVVLIARTGMLSRFSYVQHKITIYGYTTMYYFVGALRPSMRVFLIAGLSLRYTT